MKFCKNFLRIGGFENLTFFESAILNFFLPKKNCFASFPWKSVKVYWLARIAQNFDQAKGDYTFWIMPNILMKSVQQEEPLSNTCLFSLMHVCSVSQVIEFLLDFSLKSEHILWKLFVFLAILWMLRVDKNEAWS